MKGKIIKCLLIAFLLLPLAIETVYAVTALDGDLGTEKLESNEIVTTEDEYEEDVSEVESIETGLGGDEITGEIEAGKKYIEHDVQDGNAIHKNNMSKLGTKINVTKENFLDHFTLSGSSQYDQNSGIVTLTPDLANQAGSFTLNQQLDMETSSFQLKGRVNLGSKNNIIEGGGDGLGIGLHSGPVDSVGIHGNGMGLAGLENVIGFKLDTFYNDRAEVHPGVTITADPPGTGLNPFGAVVMYNHISRQFHTLENTNKAFPIIEGNRFRDIVVTYDNNSRIMNIQYADISWDVELPNRVSQSFIVSASTGAAFNLQQFEFQSMEYTPFELKGVGIPQEVTIGDNLTERDLNSFVRDITYGDVLLNPNQYELTLKEVKNDLIGSGTATVMVEHKNLGVKSEILVPLNVTLGNTLLTKGTKELSTGAYTYHPSQNIITANQGTINDLPHVNDAFGANLFYSIDLYRLTAATQNISEAQNYLSHKVLGLNSPNDAIAQFSGGGLGIPTQVGDIIKVTHEEAEKRLSMFVGGQEQKILTNKNTSFFELTTTGYQQLHINLLDVLSSGKISATTTDQEIDKMIGEFIDITDFRTLRVIGFSQYPDRSVPSSIGKILVEESLSNGKNVQFEYEVPFEIGTEATSISVTPERAGIGIGEKIDLVATVLPTSNVNPVLRWESTNEEIAVVDEQGTVLGKSKGETFITAETINGLRATARIVVEEFTFSFSGTEGNSTATVTGYLGSDEDIEIPSTAINYAAGWHTPSSVVEIGDRSLMNGNLISVVIPKSVLSIGSHAFNNNQLKEVSGMESVETIEEAAFSANELTVFTMPKSLKSIKKFAFAQNDLQSITFPESLEYIGEFSFFSNPMLREIEFLGSPPDVRANAFDREVHYIRTKQEYLKDFRGVLNAQVFRFTGGRPILFSTEGFAYSKDSYNLIEGDSLSIKIEGQGYQLSTEQSAFAWEELKFSWFKDQESLNIVGNPLNLQMVHEVDSGRYYAEIGEGINRLSLPEVDVRVVPRIDVDIPAIDPGEPEVEVPENPTKGALAIRYVSSLDFGKTKVSTKPQELISLPSKDNHGNEIPNMVSIQDMRPEEERSGWVLRVNKLEEESFVKGARLFMNPYAHQKNIDSFEIAVGQPLEINTAAQSFAWSKEDSQNPSGIVSLGMHHPDEQGVRLSIPESSGIGDYRMSLMWNLTTGP